MPFCSSSTTSMCNTLSTTQPLDLVDSCDSQSKLAKREIPRIPASSVQIDRPFLGRGSYCHVHRVKLSGESRQILQQNDQDNLARYFALKALKAQSHSESSAAATDLAVEGDILSRLQHPNIIQLHAICNADDSCSLSSSPTSMQNCLVLDLLEETLEERIKRWKLFETRSRRSSLLPSSSAQDNLRYRIHAVALGVAKAMKYLHENNVILRDLKPENIGFDKEGTVKIFDFGFAREIHTCQTTEIAGTYRYMAPEQLQAVENNSSCNDIHLASDVYSFGLVLWEICTLLNPYDQVTSEEQLISNVVHKQARPPLKSIPSTLLRNLIKKCWDPCPLNRPDFATICDELEKKLMPKHARRTSNAVQTTNNKEYRNSRSWFAGLSGSSSTTKMMTKDIRVPSVRSEATDTTDVSIEDILQNDCATVWTTL